MQLCGRPLGYKGGERREQGVREGRATRVSSPFVRGRIRLQPVEKKGEGERMQGLGKGGWGAAPLDRRLTCWEGDERSIAPLDHQLTCWEGGEVGTAPSDRRRTCLGGGGFGGEEGACTAMGSGLGGWMVPRIRREGGTVPSER